ncbi:MAG: type II toxin-antitoxin system RelE/ParE family toxin [Cytophagaceae bacterium]|nr:MAG: type II toxin-antitoxin system RelE/ParE family toxin [Cytophagaceae bacterium]
MNYTVLLTDYAVRQLKKLPPSVVAKLKDAIAGLANNPRPHGHIKLTNVEAYRIRVGNYRVIYEIVDSILTVTVIDVSDRKEAYKKR